MIYCVKFPDFLAYLKSIGFTPIGGTDTDIIFRRRDGSVLSVHRPNANGDITEASVLAACDDAEVDPPKLDVHWCD